MARFLSLFLLLLPAHAASAPSISVFGHLVPDTDTVTSAMVYAWELNERKVAATPYRLGELNPETAFVLKKLGLPLPALLKELEPKGTVAVVDTNNPDELPAGIKESKIHSIVDHHKLSGLTNSEPLEIDMRPLCSATSILYSRAKAAGLKIPKYIAGLMLAGILSDSLEFRSPTTTEMDKVHAAELGELAGLNVHDFAEGMLEAKAQVDHLTPEEIIMMDTKIFTIGGKKLRVSVMETTKPAAPLGKKQELIDAQKAIAKKDKIDECLFFVVDILEQSATFLPSSPTATAIVEKAWKTKTPENGLLVLPGVLSRKKQIIPNLEAAAKADNTSEL